MSEENPNYFAVIPASVRYDKSLSANAKLFYGEITALANKNGCCWASNKYFAELYDISERQVTRIISELKKNGYIEVELIKKGVLVERRNIYLTDKNVVTNRQKCQSVVDKNVKKPIDKNVGENNTSNINNTRVNNTNNKSEKEKSDITVLKESYYQTYLDVMKQEPCFDSNKNAYWKSVMGILKRKLKDYDLQTLLQVLEYAKKEKWVIDNGFSVTTVFCDTVIQRAIQKAPQEKNKTVKNYVIYTNNEEVDTSECTF